MRWKWPLRQLFPSIFVRCAVRASQICCFVVTSTIWILSSICKRWVLGKDKFNFDSWSDVLLQRFDLHKPTKYVWSTQASKYQQVHGQIWRNVPYEGENEEELSSKIFFIWPNNPESAVNLINTPEVLWDEKSQNAGIFIYVSSLHQSK